VVGAAEIFGAALRLCDNCSRMMPADVVEGAEDAIFAACDKDWFPGEIGRQKIALIGDLDGASGNLPVCSKDGFLLEASDAGIEIPGRRNSPGFVERIVGIVEAQKGRKSAFHHGFLDPANEARAGTFYRERKGEARKGGGTEKGLLTQRSQGGTENPKSSAKRASVILPVKGTKNSPKKELAMGSVIVY